MKKKKKNERDILHEKDQWENVNDFVFTEYIRSVLDIIDNPFNNIEAFIKQMEKLGVQTDRSRSRAFRLLDDLKKEEMSQKYISEMQKKRRGRKSSTITARTK